MVRIYPVIAALALLVLSGLGHGRLTYRWGPSTELQKAADRLNSVPLVVGEWKGQLKPMDEHQLEMAGVKNSFCCVYTNQQTHAEVTVMVVCGPHNLIATHPPTICYGGRGYQTIRKEEKYSLESSSGSADEFWMARFARSGTDPDPLLIFWGWGDSGRWTAPDHPRWCCLGSQHLYKLYVIRSLTKLDAPLEKDPSLPFLRKFLPELRGCLSPSADHK